MPLPAVKNGGGAHAYFPVFGRIMIDLFGLFVISRVAQPEEMPAVECTRYQGSWFGFPVWANQVFVHSRTVNWFRACLGRIKR